MIGKLRKQLENGETPNREDLLRLLDELGVIRADQAEYIRELERNNEQMKTLLRRCKSYIKDLEAAIRTVRSATNGVIRDQ